MPAAKLTSKGQITIPKDVRDRLGLRTGDILEFHPAGREFRLRKRVARSRIDRWVGHLTHLRGRNVDELTEEARGR
jgi:AbrB family looped-hinge helix DNA binding protein